MRLHHIYYRGYLKSCNYTCWYCPFSKKKGSQPELKKDEAALTQWVTSICTGKAGYVSILITPYGEALTHDYYWKGLARLTASRFVVAAGCQTNLSFSIQEKLQIFQTYGGDLQKLRLWCSFHGNMTSETKFVQQCRKLQEQGILFSVGTVGDPEKYAVIAHLRKLLPRNIYLWVNRMDGLKHPYTQIELQKFTAIDPLFMWEIKEPKADFTCCSGGTESIFLYGDGSYYTCNLCKKKIGVFPVSLEMEQQILTCTAKQCSCFLAYCNRKDNPTLALFDTHPSFRIPVFDIWNSKGKKEIAAIFWDIDGTIIDRTKNVRPVMKALLTFLSRQYPCYLATQRPIISAKKMCGELWGLFSGGVFADGAFLQVFGNHPKIFAMEPQGLQDIRKFAKAHHLSIRMYQQQEKVYKVTLFPNTSVCIPEEIKDKALKTYQDAYKVNASPQVISIVNQDAGKRNGLLHFCEWAGWKREQVAFVGNSRFDIEAFQMAHYSIAVSGAEEDAACAARFHLSDF